LLFEEKLENVFEMIKPKNLHKKTHYILLIWKRVLKNAQNIQEKLKILIKMKSVK